MDTITEPRSVTRTADAAPRHGPNVSRRNATLWATGVLLVIVGSLGAIALVRAGDESQAVLVAAGDLPAGARISDADLRTVEVATEDLALVPAAERGLLVGSYTKVRILAGQPFAADLVQADPVVTAGKVVVAIPVSPVQLPAQLREQSRVELVLLGAGASTAAGGEATPTVVADGVVTEYPDFGDDTGSNTVAALSVEVDPADASAIVAAGRNIGIVLLDPMREPAG
jgi:hypothetical protein